MLTFVLSYFWVSRLASEAAPRIKGVTDNPAILGESSRYSVEYVNAARVPRLRGRFRRVRSAGWRTGRAGVFVPLIVC